MDTLNPNASHRSSRREAGIIQRVRASLRRAWPSTASPHVLIACSGGLDSVVLAHILQQLAATGALRASMVHVDHGVRDDSASAATMVASFGAAIGMPVHTVRLPDDVLGKHRGAGMEEALRRERYQVVADVASEVHADLVAVAHHQRDQAETVLLHLIRGAGLQGASGMREVSTMAVPWWKPSPAAHTLTLWRPLLSEPLDALRAWHEQHDLPLADDHTNEDRQFRRNAIRHDVLPELDLVFPGAVANLARFAELAAKDNAYLDHIAMERLVLLADGGLHRSVLVDSETALQRRIVRQWILGSTYDGELTSDRIEAVRDLAARNRSGAHVEIGAGWSVVMQAGVLSLRR